MKNADKPAYPVRGATGTPFTKGDDYEEYAKQCEPTVGLTKREMFAMTAMQGLLSNAGYMQGLESRYNQKVITDMNIMCAREAVDMADELLKQLEQL